MTYGELCAKDRFMQIAEMPIHERPRERLLAHGADALADAEVLAALFGTGHRGEDALALARRLIAESGSLRALLQRPAAHLIATRGIGASRYARLIAALELARRAGAGALAAGDALVSPRDSIAFLSNWLAPKDREVFVGVFLDNRHRVLACDELASGSIAIAHVYPRQVVRRAMALNAAALIVAHNHPSGVAEPSGSDIALTGQLREALALVEVRLLDHFVIAGGIAVSLAERGLISPGAG